MTDKDTLNKVRLRNLKRAKIKQLETQLTLQIKEGESEETIQETISNIEKLKKQVKQLM